MVRKAGHRKTSRGNLLVQVLAENRRKMVFPAARILHIHRYPKRGRRNAIVFLEVKKDVRRIDLTTVIKRLGPAARHLRKMGNARRLTNSALVHALLNLWPATASKHHG
jgi:hypothetical protein